MLKQSLQNMHQSSGPTPGLCEFCEQHSLRAAANRGLIAGAVAKLRRHLAESNRKQSLEVENRKAIEHLRTFTDEQLRDIGISRMDISRAVRFGKEDI